MSVIDLIAELLEDSEALSPQEKAVGIWEVVESSGNHLILCDECGLLSDDAPPECGHESRFRFYVTLEIPQYDRGERAEERAYVSELMNLFPKKEKKNEPR